MKKLLLLFFTLICISSFAQTFENTDFGIKTSIKDIDVEVKFYNNNVVRIVKSPKGKVYEKKSFAVIATPQKVNLSTQNENNTITIKGELLQIKINTTTGKISFIDLSGKQLLAETENSTQFTPYKDSSENSFTVKQSFQLTPDEAIYGLGQHQSGRMNQRKQKLSLKQRNMYTAIPYFYSTVGYGLYWDNTSTTSFNDNGVITTFESELGDCMDYYFLYSKNYDESQSVWNELTGKVPMFPRWTFGFWQSRERYKTQDELLEVVRKYRELKVPLDGIIQDWQYWGKEQSLWSSTEFGNPGFHNPKQMVDEVHKLNAHTIISVWPSFGNKTKIFADMKKENALFDFITYPPVPEVQVYDAFNPKARDIYWDYINRNLFSIGFDGWWLDATEPDQIKPKETDDINKTYLGTFRKVRNAFPIVSTGGVYDHQRQATSEKRVVILTRSAFAGQQRFGTFNWSGDVRANWRNYKNQISNGVNMSVAGIPYWNCDIGGFSSREYPKGITDPAYQELYVRWFQFGTFLPMMRSHGTFSFREIYQFGKKGDWAYDVQEKFINLRYRLLPYIYSSAWEVTSKNSTFIRALGLEYPNDKRLYDINDQFIFGRSFLVCPVTDSLYAARGVSETTFQITKTRKVYLPKTVWYDFWTGKKYDGGVEIDYPVPMSVLPVFVKAGSIVPMGPFVQYSSEKPDNNLEIRIYAGANGEFTLYEDENDNYNYEKGAFATIRFNWNDAKQELTIEKRNGDFTGMLKSRTFSIVKVDEKNGIDLPITSKPTKVVQYDGKEVIVKL